MQRVRRDKPCVICGGHDGLPRGHGQRCTGFIGSDGKYAHCSRLERAGAIPPSNNDGGDPTYAHILRGRCNCGTTHGLDLGPLRSKTGGTHGNLPRSTAGTASHLQSSTTVPRLTAEYVYQDEQGNPLYKVLRYDPKGFKQQSFVGGVWVWGLKCEPTLYRLPEVIAAVAAGDTVYVCEGEKDVEAMRAAGVVATCNSGGAGKFGQAMDLGWLQDAIVVVVADKDDAGRNHAANVKSILTFAKSVRIVEAKAGKDAADHLAAGFGVDEFVEVPQEEATQPKEEVEQTELRRLFSRPRLSAVVMLASAPPERKWLVQDLIPLGCTGVLAAAGGTGKGHLTMQLALSLATGETFGPFSVDDPRGVLVVSREDDAGELHRRFRSACEARWVNGVDPVRAGRLEQNLDLMDFVGEPSAVLCPEFVSEVCRRISDMPGCGLVVLDPTGKLVRPEAGRSMNDAETAAVAHAFCDQIARLTGVSVLLVCHINKASKAKGADTESAAVLGSTQWVDLARWVINLKPLDHSERERYGLDPGHRYLELASPKANYSPAMAEPCIWRRTAGGALVWTQARSTEAVDQSRAFSALVERGGDLSTDEWKRACAGLEPKISERRFVAAAKALVDLGRVMVSDPQSAKGGYAKRRYSVVS